MSERIEIKAGDLLKRCTVNVTVRVTGTRTAALRLFAFKFLLMCAAFIGGIGCEVETKVKG